MKIRSNLFLQNNLNSLPENEEIPIKDIAKMKLLRAVRLFNGMAIEAIMPHGTVNIDGHWDETIDHDWVEFNFKKRFPSYYKKLMLKKNIGKSFTIPSGAIEFDKSDDDSASETIVPKKFR